MTNYARGIYTKLPREGDKVRCGDVLYRVDADPVRLRCGAVPPYRALRKGKAVFLPRPGRIAKVAVELGGPAQPGSRSWRPRPPRSRCRWISKLPSRVR